MSLGINTGSHAAVVPGRSRSAGARSVRALEPGYSGTFLYRNDDFRTGQNLAESVLTPSTVTAAIRTAVHRRIDAAAYAQPLYVPNVAIPGKGTHNVVMSRRKTTACTHLTRTSRGRAMASSFIDPADGITAVPSSDLGCDDLAPSLESLRRPSSIRAGPWDIYVVSKVKLGPGSYRSSFTLWISRPDSRGEQSGHDRGDRVRERAGRRQRGGHLRSFAAARSAGADDLERRGLSELRVALRLSAVSRLDSRLQQTLLEQEVVFNTTPNGSDGGIWEAGCGPGVDTNGNLITITGNGTFDTGASPVDYGDSFLSLTPVLGLPGSMTVASFFTPLNEMLLSDDDLDMGSGGNLLLPPQPGPYPDLVVGAGKFGTLYLVNRHSMGGFNAGGDEMVQEVPNAVVGMLSTPAYWQGTVPNVGLQNIIYTIGVDRRAQDVCNLQWADTDTARFGIVGDFYLRSRARRRLSPPTARPAASCGQSTVRPGSRVVRRCSMPSTRPT